MNAVRQELLTYPPVPPHMAFLFVLVVIGFVIAVALITERIGRLK
jgi:hypothetical protein